MGGLWGNIEIYNYALYFAHYYACLHKHDDAKKCRYLSVTNNFVFSYNSFKLFSHYKKYALPWIHL